MARRVDTKSIRIPDDGEADKYWAASSRKTGSPIVNSECPLPHIKIYSKADRNVDDEASSQYSPEA